MGDPRTKLPRKPICSSDAVGFGSDSFKGREAANSASRPNDPSQDSIVFRGWNNGAVDEESQSESGVCSPTLWGSNSPRSPQFYRSRNRSLSPTSRALAIARGQQELMEMVRNMPESCYELSLKDLVECPVSSEPDEEEEESAVERDDFSRETFFRRDTSKKRNENRALVTRSRSADSGGFYLKMFFPLSFGQMMTKNKKKKKKNKNDCGLNNSSKVSPKPPLADGSGKGVDREWWRKRSSAAGDSEGSSSGSGSSINSVSMKSSGSSSSTSSSTYRSNSRHAEAQGGCWFCISPSRSKITE